MSFGQHQSFYLRERWLSKGIKELRNCENFFNQSGNFEKIGLGKNMVDSLKFWMGSSGVIFEENKKIIISKLGELIYTYDKSIKNSFTKLLIHYKLTTNDNHNNKYCSTVLYWLFNEFDETVFNRELASDYFYRWVDRNIKRDITRKSIDKDLSMALLLYTAQNESGDPEEVTISPLSDLHILKRDDRRYIKVENDGDDIPAEIILVYMIDYYVKTGISYISIDELLKEKGSIGKILNISRSIIINKLDELMEKEEPKYKIEFIRTNNLDTITIPKVNNSEEYIEYVYERMLK